MKEWKDYFSNQELKIKSEKNKINLKRKLYEKEDFILNSQ